MSPLSLLLSGGAAALPGRAMDLVERQRLRTSGRRGWRLAVVYPAVLAWLALLLAGLVAPAPAATLATGGWHNLGVRADGSVVAWGWNFFGQCTVPAAAQSGVSAVAGAWSHSVALKADGSVVAWGDNSAAGQCTVPAAAQSGVSPPGARTAWP